MQSLHQTTSTRGITPEYAALNAQLHADRPDYGTSGQQWAKLVDQLAQDIQADTILDYGCGKQTLAKALPHRIIKGFDPAIPELSRLPEPVDLVVCTDVLEHVEPELIDDVLDELTRVTIKVAFVTVATRPAVKTLADGRNAHLTVQPLSWWRSRFEERFDIHAVQELPGYEFALILRSLIFDDLISVQLPHSQKTSATPIAVQTPGKSTVSVLKRNGIIIQYSTPNDMTRWRVQSFEQKEPSTVAWLDAMFPGSILLDVGANVGMYSLYAAVSKQMKVYAFEPESQNFALLNTNIALNQAQNRVIAYPLAISDETKADKLYLSDFTIGGSCHSFGEEVGFDLKPRESQFAQGCFSITIDQLVATNTIPVPNYIKIDVDGFEHKVLHGAEATLQNPEVKSIIVELNTNLPQHQALIEQLNEWGFVHDPQQAESALRTNGAFKGVGEFIFDRKSKTNSILSINKPLILKPPINIRARDVMHYVLDKVMQTSIAKSPFPYLVVDNIFPPEYYQDILKYFPTDGKVLRSLGETGRVPIDAYPERHCVLFNDEDFLRLNPEQRMFWSEFASWLYCEEFINNFIQKFYTTLKPRLDKILETEGQLQLKGDALLVEDRTNYAIGPHTDAPHRLVTFLFYMPSSAVDKDLGTSVYIPKDKKFVCWGGPHYPYSKFELVDTVSFLPNRLLAFPKTEHSFHGVEPIERKNISRHLLINNIRVMGKTTH